MKGLRRPVASERLDNSKVSYFNINIYVWIGGYSGFDPDDLLFGLRFW